MKPNLVIGLGNLLSGDDGIGVRVARALIHDPPGNTDVVEGGTDLLRLAETMTGRVRVILVDALLTSGRPGRVEVFDGPFEGLGTGSAHGHHLSAIEAVRLLQSADTALAKTRFTLMAVAVSGAAAGNRLSPVLENGLPHIVRRVRRELEPPLDR